jgi:hypothetical protein
MGLGALSLYNRLSVAKSARARLGRLELGKESGDLVHVRGSAGPRILAIEKSRLQGLPRNVDEIAESPATAAK